MIDSNACKTINVVQRNISWLPPTLPFVELNTDGSCSGSSATAGAGGLIRDYNGSWLVGFSRRIGCTNAICAKLWALRDGLNIAVQNNFLNLVIELDAKMVIVLLNMDKEKILYHPLNSFILD